MNHRRRYPDADDLWRAIDAEKDAGARRELLAQMARVLLELEDTGWGQGDGGDSTASLLDFQTIAHLARTRIEEALPAIDPAFRGGDLEQELARTAQEMQALTERAEALIARQQELERQRNKLTEEKQALEARQQALTNEKQALEEMGREKLALQETIGALEQDVERLKALLVERDDEAQLSEVAGLLDKAWPVLHQALRHYRRLAETLRIHQRENDAIGEALRLAAETLSGERLGELEKLPAEIGRLMDEYDGLLARLIEPAGEPARAQ